MAEHIHIHLGKTKAKDAGELATPAQIDEAKRLIASISGSTSKLPKMLQGDMVEAIKALRAANNWLK
jgi:hypothetical protein